MSNYTRTLVYLSETNAHGETAGNTLLTRTRQSDTIQFQPFQAFCRVISATNVTTGAVVNVGTNSPNFDNIISGQTIAGPSRVFELSALANPMGQLPIDVDINIRVVTPCGGTTPTLTFRIAVIGVEV